MQRFLVDPIVAGIAFCAVVLAAIGIFSERLGHWLVFPLLSVAVGFVVGYAGVQIIPMLLNRLGITFPKESQDGIEMSNGK